MVRHVGLFSLSGAILLRITLLEKGECDGNFPCNALFQADT